MGVDDRGCGLIYTEYGLFIQSISWAVGWVIGVAKCSLTGEQWIVS